MKKLATFTAASAPIVGLLAAFMLLGGGQAIADHAACNATVIANASIQDAVDLAMADEVVCLDGTFKNQNVTFDGALGHSNIALSEAPLKIAKLKANGAGGSGITLTNVTGVIIELLAIKGYPFNGIIIESGSNTNTVRNNSVKENLGNGIQVDSNSNTLTDNSMKANGKNGIRLTLNADSNTLTDNTAGRNGEDGIRVDGGVSGGSNILDGNTASHNDLNGIRVTGEFNDLDSNKANHNGFDGILLTSISNNNDLTLNKASRNGDDGIDNNGANNTCPTTGGVKNTAQKNGDENFVNCP